MAAYGPLPQVAVGATGTFVLFSSMFRQWPVAINGILGGVVLSALVTYSFFMALPITDIPLFLFEIVWQPTISRKCLLLFWAVNVLASILFGVVVSLHGRSSTIHRKFFHLTVSLIFISGLFLDMEFLWLCGWLLLCIFIIIEVLRYFSVPPWGETLNNYLLVFRDAQDGELLLTPIFLLLGIFLPLFLSYNDKEPRLYHLAGVAAVGVGDSLAAIIGSTFGTHRWPRRLTTIEGTVAMGAGMWLFLLMSLPFCAIPKPSWMYCFLVSSLVALLEAFIKNVDNLVLPLVLYVLL